MPRPVAFSLAVSLLMASATIADDARFDVEADWDRELGAYIASPNVAEGVKLPAVILVHEWWGCNDDMLERTREFASHGYYTVLVDLYQGKVTDDPKAASKLKDSVTKPAEGRAHVNKQIDATLALLKKTPSVDANRIAIAGWCMGGMIALQQAILHPDIKQCVVFYGGLETDPAELKKLTGPVLGIFGNEDKWPSPDDVNAFEAGLDEAGIEHRLHRFDGVGHAFASPSAAKMGLYSPEQSKQAWALLFAWLDEQLNPPAVKPGD